VLWRDAANPHSTAKQPVPEAGLQTPDTRIIIGAHDLQIGFLEPNLGQ
jgi:hypothetical protein